jgi:hypothetical protein
LTEVDVDILLDGFANLLVATSRRRSFRPSLPDPDDEMVMEAAVFGGAVAIATYETSTFAVACRPFFIEVLTPGEVLARIGV